MFTPFRPKEVWCGRNCRSRERREHNHGSSWINRCGKWSGPIWSRSRAYSWCGNFSAYSRWKFYERKRLIFKYIRFHINEKEQIFNQYWTAWNNYFWCGDAEFEQELPDDVWPTVKSSYEKSLFISWFTQKDFLFPWMAKMEDFHHQKLNQNWGRSWIWQRLSHRNNYYRHKRVNCIWSPCFENSHESSWRTWKNCPDIKQIFENILGTIYGDLIWRFVFWSAVKGHRGFSWYSEYSCEWRSGSSIHKGNLAITSSKVPIHSWVLCWDIWWKNGSWNAKKRKVSANSTVWSVNAFNSPNTIKDLLPEQNIP